MKGALSLLGFAVSLGTLLPFAYQPNAPQQYQVLPGVSQGNLTVFPVVSPKSANTSLFATLDEGIRSGEVLVTETGQVTGLVRPRVNDGVWRERTPTYHPLYQGGAQVNELSLINNSNRPLLLLAGEIVTGGKQDRVVGKDLIIPPHSKPVALGVFCVEPHRWTESTSNFGSLHASMAQPSLRMKAMADKNQQEVWDQVAKSRQQMMSMLSPQAAISIRASSSYAKAMQNSTVETQIDSIAKPLEHSYDALIQRLREKNAVGVVVAVNGEIIWTDVFASSDLLNRYWPKLVRSYAADSFGPENINYKHMSTQQNAQAFLDHLGATHESVETEPGIYRQTEITGDDYSAFMLTSLLPGTGFDVHFAKMKR